MTDPPRPEIRLWVTSVRCPMDLAVGSQPHKRSDTPLESHRFSHRILHDSARNRSPLLGLRKALPGEHGDRTRQFVVVV